MLRAIQDGAVSLRLDLNPLIDISRGWEGDCLLVNTIGNQHLCAWHRVVHGFLNGFEWHCSRAIAPRGRVVIDMQDYGGCELKLIWLCCRGTADFHRPDHDLDFIRGSRRKPKQAANESTIVNPKKWMPFMPVGFAALTVHQLRLRWQICSTHGNTHRLDVGIQI